MDDELSKRLEHLERREAARIALARYARAVDEGDLAGIGNHFAPAGVVRRSDGTVLEGRAAVVEYFGKLLEGRPVEYSGRHYITNIEVDLSDDGTRAVARSIFVRIAGGGAAPEVLVGSYRDELDVSGADAVCLEKCIAIEHTTPIGPGGSR